MVALPVDTRLKVEQQIEDKKIIQEFRPYLGISEIGHNCARTLWYNFRWCSKKVISNRVHRLFQRGHREEAIIQADLRSIGIIHHSDQKEVTTGHGHIKGHIDDILENIPDAPKTPHLGEYKTHNHKSFLQLKKHGLIKSKPIHYVQTICYMFALKLKRGLYIAVNKDNDERYYERIVADNEKAKEYVQRGIDIISTETPPKKISGPNWYECKWCDHYQICHFGKSPIKNCRTCVYCDIEDYGKWSCSKHYIELTSEQQKIGCDQYTILRGLK